MSFNSNIYWVAKYACSYFKTQDEMCGSVFRQHSFEMSQVSKLSSDTCAWFCLVMRAHQMFVYSEVARQKEGYGRYVYDFVTSRTHVALALKGFRYLHNIGGLRRPHLVHRLVFLCLLRQSAYVVVSSSVYVGHVWCKLLSSVSVRY